MLRGHNRGCRWGTRGLTGITTVGVAGEVSWGLAVSVSACGSRYVTARLVHPQQWATELGWRGSA